VPIVGSVVDTQTVVTLTEKAFTLAFPTDNLMVVKILTNGQYVGVPIDSTRRAIFPNCGGKATAGAITQIAGTGRPINLPINGSSLNYFGLNIGTTMTTVFYYGTPLQGSKPFTAYAGVVAASTLSGGAGTATFSFPSGKLTMIAFAASSTQTAATTILEASWATSTGQVFNAFYPMGIVTQTEVNHDFLIINLPVSITVAVTITLGTGSDVVYLYGFYQQGSGNYSGGGNNNLSSMLA
jgi:hypothetical protein